jgi:hypothetical protein
MLQGPGGTEHLCRLSRLHQSVTRIYNNIPQDSSTIFPSVDSYIATLTLATITEALENALRDEPGPGPSMLPCIPEAMEEGGEMRGGQRGRGVRDGSPASSATPSNPRPRILLGIPVPRTGDVLQDARGGRWVARVLPAASRERARTPASSQASRSTTLDPRCLGSRPPPGPDDEEEESKGESGSSRGQATERGFDVSMDIDVSPLILPTTTPLPTSQSATPHLSIDDPIRDALDIVMRATAESSQNSSPPEHYNPDPGEGWYEHIPESAHVWLDIPPLHTTNHGSSNLIPAKYLKAALVAGVPMLLGCQE